MRKIITTHLRNIGLFLMLLILNACSNPIKYNSDFRVNTDFASYTDYAWHAPNEYNEISNNYLPSPLDDERIRRNIDLQLQSKGYIRLDDEADADFLVNYSITAKDKTDITTYNTYDGYGTGWGGGYYGGAGGRYGYYGLSYGMPMGRTETRVSQYQQGSFILDIIDVSEKTLVWRGTAEGKMSKTALSQAESEKVISTIVAEVLFGFPPEP